MELSWESPTSAHQHSPRKASAKGSHKNGCHGPLAESQVTPQKEARFVYPALPRITWLRLGDSKGQGLGLLCLEKGLFMHIRGLPAPVALTPSSHYLIPKTY